MGILFSFAFVYFLGFVILLSIISYGSEILLDETRRKIENPKNDGDLKIYEFFRNLVETKGENHAHKIFYLTTSFFFLLVALAWPYVLYEYMKKDKWKF
jgi:hypothetical protein